MFKDNKTSLVWKFFKITNQADHRAKCTLCGNFYSRGKEGAPLKELGTNSLSRHLKRKHNLIYAAEEAKMKEVKHFTVCNDKSDFTHF